MILLTSNWYNEIDYSFSISHKVTNFIRQQLIKEIMEPYKLTELEKNFYLNLVVATDSNTVELSVRGPDIRKKAKFIDYGLWLPHAAINDSLYPLATYLKYYFDALKIVFLNYGVPGESIDKVYEVSKKEILNNPQYIYVEK